MCAVSRLGKSREMESRLVVGRGWRRGGLVTANGYGVSCWVDENVLKLTAIIVARLCKHTIELHALN